MDELPGVASSAKSYFERTDYKDTEFRVIDFLRPLGGGPTVEKLNQILVDDIKSWGANFEISAPQLLDDDYDFFQIKGPGRGAQFPFMNMETYTNTLGSELDALTIESLTQHRVTVLSDTSSHSLGNWSVYRCIVGSCELDGTQYAINEGGWFSVEDAFKVGAESVYQDRIIPIDPNLKTLSKKYKGKSGKKIQIQREEEYLKQVAEGSNLVLMDQKLVRLAGVTRGRGVEVCDLLDIDGKRLIHVKKGTANSAVLSHLFRQGFASAQMLKMSAEFRTNVRDEIAKFDKDSAEAFEKAIGDGTGWTVEYRIADSVRASGNHDIPFFSKLSFKDAAEKGETMGYSFRLGYIDLAPIIPPAS